MLTSKITHRGGLIFVIDLSTVHDISQTFEFFLPLKLHPLHPLVGWGGHIFLLIFWTAHDISRTFAFFTPKPRDPSGVGWVKFFLAENESHIYPNMCAKFGCGLTVVSKKRGYRQTDRQTKGRCNFIYY